jgi:hypothetical protein
VLAGAGATLAAVTGAIALRGRIRRRLSGLFAYPEFTATPALLPHDAARERRSLAVARDHSPAQNVDDVLDKLGGIERFVGTEDIVLVKVSAQWWNQGMTNVAAVKRVLERITSRPHFKGEVIVFENTHFRLANGSGLSRAWTHPSERNVDVAGYTKLGDLIPDFAGRGLPVSFVGLVDAGRSELSHHAWHDPRHEHGTYGGDGRGPLRDDEQRDGYVWDFEHPFTRDVSPFEVAQTPLTWPVFTSPYSGITIDFKHGPRLRRGRRIERVDRKLTWITLATVNEHQSTGMTACCKSAMGVVDMSAGRMGTDPRVADYRSVHYFGQPHALWRMAGPLAHFARTVRAPHLYLAVAEWVGVTPKRRELTQGEDVRLARAAAHHSRTIVAGTDPVAIDQWCARNLLMPLEGAHASLYDLNDPDALLSRFLRFYREVYGAGTLDPALVHTV